MGVPPVIIFFRMDDFPIHKNHQASLGYPQLRAGNPEPAERRGGQAHREQWQVGRGTCGLIGAGHPDGVMDFNGIIGAVIYRFWAGNSFWICSGQSFFVRLKSACYFVSCVGVKRRNMVVVVHSGCEDADQLCRLCLMDPLGS